MYDVMLSQLNYRASAILNGQETALRQASSAHPYFVPAQVFRTKDSWLVLFITHDSFWRLFCEAVGHPEWVGSPEHGTISARSRNRAKIGRASCRESVCTYVSISWVAVSLKNKIYKDK